MSNPIANLERALDREDRGRQIAELAAAPAMLNGGFRVGDAVLIRAGNRVCKGGRISKIDGYRATVTVDGQQLQLSSYQMVFDDLDADVETVKGYLGVNDSLSPTSSDW